MLGFIATSLFHPNYSIHHHCHFYSTTSVISTLWCVAIGTMADRHYQQYPGQLNSTPTYPPYPSASPQPGYGGPRPVNPLPFPSTHGYPTPPSTSPQPSYQTSYAPSPYGPPPQYGQQTSYGRPPPPAPQSYGGTTQSQALRQQSYQYPSQSSYPQTIGYGYVRYLCFNNAKKCAARSMLTTLNIRVSPANTLHNNKEAILRKLGRNMAAPPRSRQDLSRLLLTSSCLWT